MSIQPSYSSLPFKDLPHPSMRLHQRKISRPYGRRLFGVWGRQCIELTARIYAFFRAVTPILSHWWNAQNGEFKVFTVCKKLNTWPRYLLITYFDAFAVTQIVHKENGACTSWNFTATFTELHGHGGKRWPRGVTSRTYIRGVDWPRFSNTHLLLFCFLSVVRLRFLPALGWRFLVISLSFIFLKSSSVKIYMQKDRERVIDLVLTCDHALLPSPPSPPPSLPSRSVRDWRRVCLKFLSFQSLTNREIKRAWS